MYMWYTVHVYIWNHHFDTSTFFVHLSVSGFAWRKLKHLKMWCQGMDLYQWKFSLPRGHFPLPGLVWKRVWLSHGLIASAPFQFQCSLKIYRSPRQLVKILHSRGFSVPKGQKCPWSQMRNVAILKAWTSISEISETLSSATLPSGICPLVQIDNSGQPYTPRSVARCDIISIHVPQCWWRSNPDGT